MCAGTIPGLEKAFGLKHIKDPEVQRIKDINTARDGLSMSLKPTLQKEWKDEMEQTLST